MAKNKKKEETKGNAGYPQNDQFIEGKIGSGFMSTLEGQPYENEKMVERIKKETLDETEK